MRILLSRTRISEQAPRYAYRVHVPFTEISHERQALIAAHTDYGFGAGLLARLADVLAPLDHLQAAPGLDRHREGRLIEAVVDRIGALLLAAAFPEMTAPTMPFRLDVPSAPINARVFGRIDNLSGAYDRLASTLDGLTSAGLRWRVV